MAACYGMAAVRASTEPGRGDREQLRWRSGHAMAARLPQRSPVVVTGSSRPKHKYKHKRKEQASTEPGRGDREQIDHADPSCRLVRPQRSPVVVTGSRSLVSASTSLVSTWPQRSPVVVTGSRCRRQPIDQPAIAPQRSPVVVTGSSRVVDRATSTLCTPQRSPVVVTGSSRVDHTGTHARPRASTEPGRGDREQRAHTQWCVRLLGGLNGARSW